MGARCPISVHMSEICKIVSEFYETGKIEDAEEHYVEEQLRFC